MTDTELRSTVLEALQNIAPEADLSTLKPAARIRDQLDMDSMDFLNFIIALHTALKIDIPERDYPKLTSIDSCIRYLAAVTTEKLV